MQTIDQIPAETEEIQELTDEQLNALAMSAPEVTIEPVRKRFPWRSLIWSLVVCAVLAWRIRSARGCVYPGLLAANL